MAVDGDLRLVHLTERVERLGVGRRRETDLLLLRLHGLWQGREGGFFRCCCCWGTAHFTDYCWEGRMRVAKTERARGMKRREKKRETKDEGGKIK